MNTSAQPLKDVKMFRLLMGEWIPQPRLVSFVAKSRRWLRFLSQ
jgi:hypothetical protein